MLGASVERRRRNQSYGGCSFPIALCSWKYDTTRESTFLVSGVRFPVRKIGHVLAHGIVSHISGCLWCPVQCCGVFTISDADSTGNSADLVQYVAASSVGVTHVLWLRVWRWLEARSDRSSALATKIKSKSSYAPMFHVNV